MTISATTRRFDYTGNGVTVDFSFPRPFLLNTDLKVYLVLISTGVATLQTYSTDYSVAGAGLDAGGTVTFLVAPSALYKVVIFGDTDATQNLDLDAVTSWPMTAIEYAFDRLTILVQEMWDRLLRVPFAPRQRIDTFDYELPLPTPTYNLGINAAGTGWEYHSSLAATWITGSGAPGAGVGVAGDMYLDTATGDVYGPKTTIWGAIIANITGATGPAGPPGAGTGDVVGPAGATNNHLALFDLATGKLIKSSGFAVGTLGTWAGITPSANGQSLVASATYATMRGLLDLEAGTDFYSIAAANAAFQGLDADLTAIAALTTAAAGRSILPLADPNADRIAFWDDSLGAFEWLTLGTNLSITGTTINASGGGATRVSGASGAAGADETWQSLSSDYTNATGTPSDAFTTTSVGAGVWDFEYVLIVQQSSGSGGFRLTIQHSGTVTEFVFDAQWTNRMANFAAALDQRIDFDMGAPQPVSGWARRASGGEITMTDVDTSNADMRFVVKGTVIVTGTGSLTLAVRRDTGGTVTIKDGSHLILKKIA